MEGVVLDPGADALLRMATERRLKELGTYKCSACSKFDARVKCSRCKVCYYCDSNCQRIHWKGGHKKVCIQNTVEGAQLIDKMSNDMQQLLNPLRTSDNLKLLETMAGRVKELSALTRTKDSTTPEDFPSVLAAIHKMQALQKMFIDEK